MGDLDPVAMIGDLEAALGRIPTVIVHDPAATWEQLVVAVRDGWAEYEGARAAVDKAAEGVDIAASPDAPLSVQIGSLADAASAAEGRAEDADAYRHTLVKVSDQLEELAKEVDDALR